MHRPSSFVKQSTIKHRNRFITDSSGNISISSWTAGYCLGLADMLYGFVMRSPTIGNTTPLTSLCLSLPLFACLCLSLCLSLPVSASLCLYLPLSSSLCLSLPVSVSLCLYLPLFACFCFSVSLCFSLFQSASLCLPFPQTLEDHIVQSCFHCIRLRAFLVRLS